MYIYICDMECQILNIEGMFMEHPRDSGEKPPVLKQWLAGKSQISLDESFERFRTWAMGQHDILQVLSNRAMQYIGDNRSFFVWVLYLVSERF